MTEVQHLSLGFILHYTRCFTRQSSLIFPEIHRIGHMDDKTWLLGNINQTGYFRVNYDLQNWKLLIQQLQTNHQVRRSVRTAGCTSLKPSGGLLF